MRHHKKTPLEGQVLEYRVQAEAPGVEGVRGGSSIGEAGLRREDGKREETVYGGKCRFF
jgi:hypothetical protein